LLSSPSPLRNDARRMTMTKTKRLMGSTHAKGVAISLLAACSTACGAPALDSDDPIASVQQRGGSDEPPPSEVGTSSCVSLVSPQGAPVLPRLNPRIGQVGWASVEGSSGVPSRSENSAGYLNTVSSAAPGMYIVTMPGIDATEGNVQVTAAGQSNARCNLV